MTEGGGKEVEGILSCHKIHSGERSAFVSGAERLLLSASVVN